VGKERGRCAPRRRVVPREGKLDAVNLRPRADQASSVSQQLVGLGAWARRAGLCGADCLCSQLGDAGVALRERVSQSGRLRLTLDEALVKCCHLPRKAQSQVAVRAPQHLELAAWRGGMGAMPRARAHRRAPAAPCSVSARTMHLRSRPLIHVSPQRGSRARLSCTLSVVGCPRQADPQRAI
jgi:hypothetical protein